jgi:hypothetical protein
LPEFALGTASHAADQLVSRDAVTRAKLLRALKLNSVGEGPIRFVGRLRQSCPPKHLNDLPFRDQQGNKHLSFGRCDQVILAPPARGGKRTSTRATPPDTHGRGRARFTAALAPWSGTS